MTKFLRDLVTKIQEASQKVYEASAKAQTNSQHLAQAADQISAMVQQTSSAVQEQAQNIQVLGEVSSKIMANAGNDRTYTQECGGNQRKRRHDK